MGYVPRRKISNKFICSTHLNCQFSAQWICWNKLQCSFFESPRSEQDLCAPIFSVYMTLAQRTREVVKYFEVKLYIFLCNYLEYHLVSWGSNLRYLLANTFIYQNLLEYFVPFAPSTEILEYYGGEMILHSVFVAQRQNFKVKHSPGITLNKFV